MPETDSGTVDIHDFYTAHNLRLHEVEVGFKYPRTPNWPESTKTAQDVQLALYSSTYNKYSFILDDEHLVVDIDVHNPNADGYASLAKMESAIGIRLQDVGSAYVKTPSGGKHYYFTKPKDLELSRCYSAYPGVDFLDGLKNKQVIAANSYHDTHDGQYELFGTELLPVPSELLNHLIGLSNRAKKEQGESFLLRDPLPGDVMMRSWEGVEVLKTEMEARGYVFRECDDYYEYDRPGKTTSSERSGHLGKTSEAGVYQLTSFTLSDPTFDTGVSHTIFHAYANLVCDGNETDAANRLSSRFNPRKMAEEDFDRIMSGAEDGVRRAVVRSDVVNILALEQEYHTPRPVLIDGVLRRGEIMNIIAAPKTGKSWLLLQMLMAIATGGEWLGYGCMAGRVLLIDNELHPETIASRFRTMRDATSTPQGMLKDNFDVLNLRGKQKDIKALAEIITSVPKGYYSLIAMDAMYRFWMKGSDENSNADVTQFYNVLDAYARVSGASIAMVHHTSKGDQSDRQTTDVGAGAGAIARAADTHLTIRPHETDDMAVLDMVCRSFPSPERRSLEFRFPFWGASRVAPVLRNPRSAAQGDRDSQLEQEVLEFIVAHPDDEITARFLRDGMGIGPQRADRIISIMLADGSIRVVGERTNRNHSVSELYGLTETDENPDFLNE